MEKRLTGAQTKARQIQGRRRKNCVEKKKKEKGAQTISTRIAWGGGEERGQNLFRAAGGDAAAASLGGHRLARLAFLAASTSASSPGPVWSWLLPPAVYDATTDHAVCLQPTTAPRSRPLHDFSHGHRANNAETKQRKTTRNDRTGCRESAVSPTAPAIDS
ncbi:uncharacterized protein TRUGW13939_00091 [Talaromyces rugulosus]|uniref:Uncharacterized protein n=1 Tax=Talaromyces rugulosus TaxID=121627 RepID=A0A7H8QGD5_TALRU|nr:uncharacterized protein TRUGW13939_00091 [Talaromyces rugulosus]QKX53020.1 hypothetical protein TRUGW13939_00091 [Talaromyces rugulosus]